ncbi:MAG: LysR family transcriptional regulator [Betaproteobacteria bacterium]
MALFEAGVRSFEEAARHGSIRRAAEHLHLTASSVDRQILRLERAIGEALFERLPHGVRLTAAGEVLLATVRRMRREAGSAMAAIEDLKGLHRGSVSVHALQFLAEGVLPEVITAFRKAHPGVTCVARTGNSDAIVKAVLEAEADIGICGRPPRGLPLRTVKSVSVRLGAVFGPRHDLAARKRQIAMRDCLEYPLLLPDAGMQLRALIDELRPRTLVGRPAAVETNSIALLKALLERGGGVGFLTDADVKQEVATGRLVYRPLADKGSALPDLCVVVRGGRALPRAAERMLHYLEAGLR